MKKLERWIGSKKCGFIEKIDNVYVLSIFIPQYCDFTYEFEEFILFQQKRYKHKQSAIRYIKSNF